MSDQPWAVVTATYRGMHLDVLITDMLADAPHDEVLREAIAVLIGGFEDAGYPGLTREDLVITIHDYIPLTDGQAV